MDKYLDSMFHAQVAVQALSNNDITVRGSYLGLDVQISSKAATYLESLGSNANQWLLQALHDEEKFAAAHVLLTKINAPSYDLSSGRWNEMDLSLEADGSVDFHSSQIPNLVNYWQGILAN